MEKKESSKSDVSAFTSTIGGNSRERKKITIVGVGLIGGSLALQLHEKKLSSKLIGVDNNKEHAKKAIELELVDEIMTLDNAIAASDVIVLAIPVDKLVDLLPSILSKIDDQIV